MSLGPRLGAHMSIAGGPASAFARGRSVDCQTMQVFARSPNRWASPPLTDEQACAYRAEAAVGDIWPVVAHGSYLINLASPEDDLWMRSRHALADELDRCLRLGIETYVLHPGSHRGSGAELGLDRVRRALDAELATRAGITVALETTAGQGDVLGRSLSELAWVLEHAECGPSLGVCVDTAHVLAAGYDCRTPETYDRFWREVETTVGVTRVRVVHLNDSKADLGQGRDRHEQIGDGFLGLTPFELLVNDAQLRHIPMLLETPKGRDLVEDRRNLKLLQSLIR